MDEKTRVITNKLRKIYSDVLKREIDHETFNDGTGLVDKLHIDSLNGLQIIVKVEQIFQVVIEDDEAAITMINCLPELVKFIVENTVNP